MEKSGICDAIVVGVHVMEAWLSGAKSAVAGSVRIPLSGLRAVKAPADGGLGLQLALAYLRLLTTSEKKAKAQETYEYLDVKFINDRAGQMQSVKRDMKSKATRFCEEIKQREG
ncbi:hypothetical protein HK101_001695 [Irineochytrium annulatum]|nr:hypothetical protein HK101_001695 [Irineochytrium annulatum]